MYDDTEKLKPELKRYIQLKAIKIIETDKERCTCPAHVDNNPSCIIYPDKAYCPVCNLSFDIFEFAILISS